MTTKNKRIQVALSSKTLQIVEQLAKQNDCSLSKVVSRLLDESLESKGVKPLFVQTVSPFESFYLK